MQKPDLGVIISGGGTGGHIFPAIAIANAIKHVNPKCRILFVGAKGRMEMQKVPAAGYDIVALNISGFQRSLSFGNLLFPFKVISSLIRSYFIIKKFKPSVAVGVGGYASGPLLYAASRMSIPTLIQEQNSYPGITNKILAGKVNKICVAYHGMNRYFPESKTQLTGNPVRNEMVAIEGKRNDALSYFGIDGKKKTVLVVGGSQGARSINVAIGKDLIKFSDAGVALIWQCGTGYLEHATASLSNLNYPDAKAFDFIARMDLAYAIADVIISRAGASTISELCIVGKPAILVPLPTAAEDHQTHNCKALVEKNAAVLIRDADTSEKLVQAAFQIIKNHNLSTELGKNISELAVRDAADIIANEVLSLADQHISE